MNSLKPAFAVLCLSAVCASAYSQEFASEFSFNNISLSKYAGPTNSGYIVYELAGLYANGAAYTDAYASGIFSEYSYAANRAEAGPGYGFAQISYGFAQYMTFTNHSVYRSGRTYTVTCDLTEKVSTSSGGTAWDYGGMEETGAGYFLGYNTIYQTGTTSLPYDFAHNWSIVGGFTTGGYSYIMSEGSFTQYLAYGQSFTVEVWASGITLAHSAAVQNGTPGPEAVAPFALGLLGALRRRRKS